MKHGRTQNVVKLASRRDEATAANLAEIVTDLKYSAEVRAKLATISKQLTADGGFVMAGDVVQLREVGDLLTRAEELQGMMAAAKEQGEMKAWITLSRLRDNQVAIFRALLRDLGVTKSSLNQQGPSARESKAATKSGAGWDGLI